jgi:hypothetical protein
VAVVTWPLSSGEARGRVGDLIYNTRRGTSYVKSYAHYQSGLSDKQQQVQAAARTVTTTWHGLSEVEKPIWDDFARRHPLKSWTGQRKRLSGYNWCMRLNCNLYLRTGTTNSLPPDQLDSLIIPALAAVADPLGIIVSWDFPDGAPEYSWYVEAWLQGPDANPQAPTIKRAQYATHTYLDELGLLIVDPPPGHYNVFVRTFDSWGSTMPWTTIPIEVT